MLKAIRNLSFGWIIILIGTIVIVTGFSMTEDKVGEKTFLCFDKGCIYIQGISSIAIGILSIVIGVYLISKNKI